MFASDKPFDLLTLDRMGQREVQRQLAEDSDLVCPTVTRTLSVASL